MHLLNMSATVNVDKVREVFVTDCKINEVTVTGNTDVYIIPLRTSRHKSVVSKKEIYIFDLLYEYQFKKIKNRPRWFFLIRINGRARYPFNIIFCIFLEPYEVNHVANTGTTYIYYYNYVTHCGILEPYHNVKCRQQYY